MEEIKIDAIQIGVLAKRYGLNSRTLRYYEAIGLIRSMRLENGYRSYSEQEGQRLAFILKAKRSGFSLKEIETILRLGRSGSACDFVRATVARHISILEAKIGELTQLRGELLEVQTRWQEQGQASSEKGLCLLFDAWTSSNTSLSEKTKNGKKK